MICSSETALDETAKILAANACILNNFIKPQESKNK